VPLPLRLGFMELPVVGDVPGVAELAAGSPVVEPRPLGGPLCANAKLPASVRVAANRTVVSFMVMLSVDHDNSPGEAGFRGAGNQTQGSSTRQQSGSTARIGK
jgi:hypothetical protein